MSAGVFSQIGDHPSGTRTVVPAALMRATSCGVNESKNETAMDMPFGRSSPALILADRDGVVQRGRV
ncbi:hypothetical protein GCM10009844_10440 [Nocardioides koreensis]|uniref:Uncharacterized protein n=1 Tax=Nocardioides koreensis TaxID=433651 RepID=A0ABP5L1W9_9ACTN